MFYSGNKKLLDPTTCYSASLDIGIKFTGITLWHLGKHLKTFCLENKNLNKATAPVTAFKLIRERLTGDFRNSRYLVIIEDYGYGGGHFTVEQAEIVGQLKAFIADNPEYALVGIAPNTIKKCVTGNGKAKKPAVKKAMEKLGYKTSSSHEADSLAVFHTYLSIWQEPSEAVIARSINV